MHKIENMIVFGGTHGNEFTGVEVIKLLEKRNYFGKNLNLIGHFANRKAFELGKRFVDKDLNRSFTKEVLEKGGFLHEERVAKEIYDKYANPNNLIITICDQYGRPVGFTARNLIFDGVLDDGGRYVNGPKYIATNCKGLKVNVFNKADRLFNLHEAKKNHPPLYIFEGHPDVITANLHGLKNAVAIGAVSLTPQHLNLCRRLGIYDLVICLDRTMT